MNFAEAGLRKEGLFWKGFGKGVLIEQTQGREDAFVRGVNAVPPQPFIKTGRKPCLDPCGEKKSEFCKCRRGCHLTGLKMVMTRGEVTPHQGGQVAGARFKPWFRARREDARAVDLDERFSRGPGVLEADGEEVRILGKLLVDGSGRKKNPGFGTDGVFPRSVIEEKRPLPEQPDNMVQASFDFAFGFEPRQIPDGAVMNPDEFAADGRPFVYGELRRWIHSTSDKNRK